MYTFSNKYDDDFVLSVVKDVLENKLTNTQAGEKYDIARKTIGRWVRKLEFHNKYQLRPSQTVTAISRLHAHRDENGVYQAAWVRTDVKAEKRQKQFEDYIHALNEEIKLIPIVQPPKSSLKDILTNYVISDFHLGQYSDINEIGIEWTLDNSFECIKQWFIDATNRAPDTETAILCDLGDFLHADGLIPATPSSGHILDVSSRFRSVFDMAMTIFDNAIGILLKKHENVHVIICEGNHDLNSAYLMTVAVARKYENNPRVTFDFSHIPYYAYEWGNNSLFFTHGHLRGINNVAQTMASNFREMFGRTKYSTCFIGHLHHKAVKETELMEIIQQTTIAPKDAYSKRHGYHANRGANIYTFDKYLGPQDQYTVRPRF